MRSEKILLINPRYSRRVFAIPILPAGLGYVAESLKASGIEYDIFDMNFNYTYNDLRGKIAKFKPQLIGISLMSYKLESIYSLVSQIKKEFPHIKIVVGGPHVSSIRIDIFKECTAFDYGVVLEGEDTLVELCRGMPINEIKGLVYKKDGNTEFNGERPFIRELDSIPFPRYDKFELERYGYGIGIVSSRGCPYSCLYCSCNIIGKIIRFRSSRNVVDEIAYWHDKGCKEFGFQEDNPTFNRQRILEICDEIVRTGLSDIRIMCGNGVRADRIDRELLKKMKEAGFKRLAIGVESGSEKVLKAIKKGADLADMESAIKYACELGFFVSLFFLVGSPSETMEDVDKTIKLAMKYPVHDISFFNLVPMPGSELYDWVAKNRYFVRMPREYLNAEPHPARSSMPIFQTPDFSLKERIRALKKTQQISRLVRRRTMQKRFRYLGPVGNIIFWFYTLTFAQKMESVLLSNELFRRSVGQLRMSIRNKFYK